jgi:hypothetical protein
MLTQKEKIRRAMELLKMKTPMRIISKDLNMSYSTICLIKRRMLSHSKDEKEKSTTKTSKAQLTKDDNSIATVAAISIRNDTSKHSQGLNLLLEKKSLVEISILLDLETNDVLKIYDDFLILQKMEKVADILIENKNNLDAFLNLQSHIVKHNIDVRKAWPKLNLEMENSNLKEENKILRFEKETAIDVRWFWEDQFIKLNGKYQNLLNVAERKRPIAQKHTTRSL